MGDDAKGDGSKVRTRVFEKAVGKHNFISLLKMHCMCVV